MAKERYYLFPGDGRANRERRVRTMIIAFIVGTITAGGIATIIYLLA